MHLHKPESGGSAVQTELEQPKKTLLQQKQYGSSALPFGQPIALYDIHGPTYLTAQALIQQVAYTLSSRVYSYSPDTFDLDISLKQWASQKEKNAYGDVTAISASDVRAGAGNAALGYMLSSDLHGEKHKLPQTIVASSAGLQHMRHALDQISLLYNRVSPTVAHVAAIDFAASGFVTDYVTPMSIANELEYGLVASTSSYEVQHMALLSTLLAKKLPTLHVYDGINVGRETTRIVDVQDKSGLFKAYDSISDQVKSYKRRDIERDVVSIMDAFNSELGTDYKPFEYYGHAEPESVLVVFGTVEGSLACQLAYALSNQNEKVGAINVRVYRPFAEEAFLKMLPSSVRHLTVLGQVMDRATVLDDAEHSNLYRDVLAAVSLDPVQPKPVVSDLKYARDEEWTPRKLLSVLQNPKDAALKSARKQDNSALDILGPTVEKYIFWDLDDSAAADAPTAIAQLLSRNSSENITLRSDYDNLVRGGLIRSEIRCSSKSIEAPYAINAANISHVRDENVLQDFNVLASLADKGTILLRLPGAKEQDADKVEKRLPIAFRKGLVAKGAKLFLIDPTAAPSFAEHQELEGLLSQLAFLRLARNDLQTKLEKFAAMYGEEASVLKLTAEFEGAMWELPVPSEWSTLESEAKDAPKTARLKTNSFRPFVKSEAEHPTFLKSWRTAAKGLAFKEATSTSTQLRPDTGVKQATVTVKEHRRLTPIDYDRNVFHIEFDLGNSGLKYEIGEALGIHHENDHTEVANFISWYGLDASDVVEVPAREDPDHLLENRTVFQALSQNLDIFGRPPKRFYEALADFATDSKQQTDLLALGGATSEGAVEFKRRAEVDTTTYEDVLKEFSSARPSFHDLVRIVTPMKRREYSIASSQKVTPNAVSLLIVTVHWTTPSGTDRFGQATRYLNNLPVGAPVTVSVKPSVMKLPPLTSAPLIMAGLGTGLAPFRAFVQERAYQRDVLGHDIGDLFLFMGSRHQREEYLYGEEWEAYLAADVLSHMGCAFSRDQPQKIYIQDRMRQALPAIKEAYLAQQGSFYLCGPTWPVPDVTAVLEEGMKEVLEAELEREVAEGKKRRKVDTRRWLEELKEEGRYVLEVY